MMRRFLMFVILLTPSSAAASDLATRIEVCRKATDLGVDQRVSPVQVLRSALERSSMPAAEKVQVMETCLAFWSGLIYRQTV